MIIYLRGITKRVPEIVQPAHGIGRSVPLYRDGTRIEERRAFGRQGGETHDGRQRSTFRR